jgi:hypothetical protein
MEDLGKTNFFLRFTIGAPSYMHFRTSISLCLENIGEIQYG